MGGLVFYRILTNIMLLVQIKKFTKKWHTMENYGSAVTTNDIKLRSKRLELFNGLDTKSLSDMMI
jgi:hypothetical protein